MSTPVLLPEPDVRRRHRRYFVLLLVALLLVAFFFILTPILMGVVGGILLWVLTRDMYEWLLKRTHGRCGLAGGLSIIGTLLLVVIPLTALITLMVTDAASLGEEAKGWIAPIQPQIDQSIQTLTKGRDVELFGFRIRASEIRERAAQLTTQAGNYLLGLVSKTASGILSFTVMLFVALYTLYYFYMDGYKFIEWLKGILPLDPAHSDQLINSFFDTSVATLKMLIIIGIVQGAACGVAFWAVGAPAVIFLTVLAMISTVIPSFGPGLVIIPVAVGLLFAGKTWYAVGLLAWGGIVVGNLDNILRPYLVHRAIAIHQLVIFVAMVGGIVRFGFFGVLIGPVVASLLKASLDVYREIFRGAEPEPTVPGPPTTISGP